MQKKYQQIMIAVIAGVIVLIMETIIQGVFLQKEVTPPPSNQQQPIIINITNSSQVEEIVKK